MKLLINFKRDNLVYLDFLNNSSTYNGQCGENVFLSSFDPIKKDELRSKKCDFFMSKILIGSLKLMSIGVFSI